MSQKNPWTRLESRLIYENPWIRVREDQVVSPHGARGIYGVIETRLATGVVALSDDQKICLVGQYRYPTEEYSWEIPEGGANLGEPGLEAARRELREETGLEAERWERLGGEVHLSNCFSAERGELFLAQGLREGAAAPDDTELLEVRWVPFSEALQMVDCGEIKDSLSIIGILRASRMLNLLK
jgi:8-oxo-dGTP pyrophosphatase MutT (NUDIX family)